MADNSKNSITIEASASDVYVVLADPANYPAWSTSIKSAKVLEADASGRATKIEMSIKAGQLKDRVVLEYDWSSAPAAISFSLDDADMLTEMSGSYSFVGSGDETVVTYELTVALSMPVPAMMRHKAELDTINLALKELKAKMEE